jgi:hypothetical protein
MSCICFKVLNSLISGIVLKLLESGQGSTSRRPRVKINGKKMKLKWTEMDDSSYLFEELDEPRRRISMRRVDKDHLKDRNINYVFQPDRVVNHAYRIKANHYLAFHENWSKDTETLYDVKFSKMPWRPTKIVQLEIIEPSMESWPRGTTHARTKEYGELVDYSRGLDPTLGGKPISRINEYSENPEESEEYEKVFGALQIIELDQDEIPNPFDFLGRRP